MLIYRSGNGYNPFLDFSEQSVLLVALSSVAIDGVFMINQNEYLIYTDGSPLPAFAGHLTAGVILAIGLPKLAELDHLRRQGVVDDRMMRVVIDIISDIELGKSAGKVFSLRVQILLGCMGKTITAGKKSLIDFEAAVKLKEYIDSACQITGKAVSSRDLHLKTKLSVVQLRTLSRSLYGLPLNKLIFITSMQKAFESVVVGTETIEFVARQSGYSSRQNFITSFKRRFNVTPDRVRLNIKEGRR